MKNLQSVLTAIELATLKVSGEKINQTQRNQIKGDLIQALQAELVEQGLDATTTDDGVVVRVENETASVYLAFDVTVKNLDYDFDGAVAEHNEKVAARLERERLLAEKREKVAQEKAEKEKIKKTK